VPLDLTFVLWVGSLLLSAVLVGVFLWLMRDPQKASGGEPPGAGPERSERDD
jgi:hypothetical protein